MCTLIWVGPHSTIMHTAASLTTAAPLTTVPQGSLAGLSISVAGQCQRPQHPLLAHAAWCTSRSCRTLHLSSVQEGTEHEAVMLLLLKAAPCGMFAVQAPLRRPLRRWSCGRSRPWTASGRPCSSWARPQRWGSLTGGRPPTPWRDARLDTDGGSLCTDHLTSPDLTPSVGSTMGPPLPHILSLPLFVPCAQGAAGRAGDGAAGPLASPSPSRTGGLQPWERDSVSLGGWAAGPTGGAAATQQASKGYGLGPPPSAPSPVRAVATASMQQLGRAMALSPRARPSA